MDSITITIKEYSEGGYYYDIYDHEHGADCEDAEECESEDGGWCTTTMANALGMAESAARDLIERKKGRECAGCGDDCRVVGDSPTPYVTDDGHTIEDVCKNCMLQKEAVGDFIGER